MATSIVLALDARKPKKDGTFPIIFRLVHNTKTTSIKSGYWIKKTDWNIKDRKVKSSYKGSETPLRLNNLLQKKRSEMTDQIMRLDEKGELKFLSVVQVRERMQDSKPSQTFFTYTEKLINDLRKAKRIGNAKSYRAILNVIKKYRKDKDFTFNELNLAFLKKFEVNHLAKGNSLNGLAVYMKTIRAIFNQAVKDGFADRDAYPFDDYTIRTTKTKKRAIDFSLIQRLANLELDKDSTLYRDRQIFLMSFYLMPMQTLRI